MQKANKRLKAASAALRLKHKGGEWEEFNAANKEVLSLERKLAKSKSEPYAIPAQFPVKWDTGAPLPHLLCNDSRAFLTFYVDEPDPNWDGSYINMVDPNSSDPVKLCLVTFNFCVSAKLGHPNDEALRGHPLSGRGLDGYTAQIVKNSPWISEIAKTNSVHPCDNPKWWKELNHYVFWFHDSTFECIAESYSVAVTTETMGELLTRVQTELLK